MMVLKVNYRERFFDMNVRMGLKEGCRSIWDILILGNFGRLFLIFIIKFKY